MLGETVYEIGITEQEGLRPIMIKSGDSMRHMGQVVAGSEFDRQFESILEAFKVSGKGVPDPLSPRLSVCLYCLSVSACLCDGVCCAVCAVCLSVLSVLEGCLAEAL